MEERKEIKLKILLLVILSIPIIISVLFIIGVNKVYAANRIFQYNDQGEILDECLNINECTLKGLYFVSWQFDMPISTNKGTNINVQMKFETYYRYRDMVVNETPVQIFLYGTVVTNITNQCNITGTQSVTSSAFYTEKIYKYEVNCNLTNNQIIANVFGATTNVSKTNNGDNPIYNLMRIKITDYNVNTTPNTSSTEDAINASSSNIINNQNQNTQDIINNNNQNTQDIIDNQNANSQAEIDKIDETFNTCENFTSTNDMGVDGKYLYENGNYYNNQDFAVSNYIQVNKGKIYLLTMGTNSNAPSYCLYGTDKSLIRCQRYGGNNTFNIDMPVDGFIRYSWGKNTTTTLSGEYCYNRLDGKPYNKKPVDTTNSEDYQEKEQELLDLYNDDQLDTLYILENTDGNNWVWARITQFLNTNEYIRLMIISILSLGIIKLVLSR